MMRIALDEDELRPLIREVVAEVLQTVDWPEGRIALTEAEAAEACGVRRHVLRDLRLAGKITGRRLGKRIVYTRQDLLNALSHHDEASICAISSARRDYVS
jgi:hypothetical protein